MERAVLQTPLDRYVILEYLAEGGMGAIYLGKKLGMGGFEKEVVLKQLLPEFTEQPEFIDLFLREARLSASLDHANIVHTIDLVAAGNDFFIVMEFVRGGDLRTLLKRAKRRDRVWKAEAALFIGREVLAALAYAHAKTGTDGKPLSLIHRDVSPSNILLSHSGEVKLTDFGIAKANTHRSVFYKVKGKVGYMSPEQARGEKIDHRSDLYSSAVCLYEILTGERLFVGDLSMSAEQIYSQPVPRISEKRLALPDDLDQVMDQALASDPDDRFQSAGEFSDALLRVAHRHGLMYGAPDLAAHLRELCGDDVGSWMHLDDGEEEDDDDGPGTELLSAPGGTGQSRISQISQFSGRELTSVIDAKTFVPRGASLSELFSSVDGSRSDVSYHEIEQAAPVEPEERTRHYAPNPAGPKLTAPRPAAPRSTGSRSLQKSVRQSPVLVRAGVPDLLRAQRATEGRRVLAAVLVVAALGLGIVVAIGLTRPDLTQSIEETPTPAHAKAADEAPHETVPQPQVVEVEPPPPAAGTHEMHDAHGTAQPGRGVTLEIASQPTGGSVTLDGRTACTTPCKIRNLSREPVHVLKVAHEGYQAWATLVDVRGRAADHLFALLRPRPADDVGWLLVRSNKVAEIYLNGKEVGGVIGGGRIPLRPGAYDLELVAPRVAAKPQAQVKVEKGTTTTVHLPFK